MTTPNAIIMHQPSMPSILQPTVQSDEQINSIARLAKFVAASTLVKVNNEFDAFFIMQYGWELGISPMAALRTIYIVNGVPTCSGEMMLALIRKSGLAKEINISGDAEKALVIMKRTDGTSYEATFTKQDAIKANLWQKNVWQAYPQKMLRWRAVSECGKFLFGDVLGGLYTIEEIAPDSDLNEAGELVGDIVIEGDKKANKPANKSQADNKPKDATPPADEDANWYDDPKNIQYIITSAQAKGYGNNEAELLTLIDAKNWKKFATGKEAFGAIQQAHEALAAELEAKNKPASAPAEEAEPSAPAEPTWSDDDTEALKAHLDINYPGKKFDDLFELDESDFNHDFKAFYSNADSAIKAIDNAAQKHRWLVTSDEFTVTQKGKNNIVTFKTIIGDIKIFSRSALAEMLEKIYPEELLADLDIKNAEPGTYMLPLNISIDWEQKNQYRALKAVYMHDVPF